MIRYNGSKLSLIAIIAGFVLAGFTFSSSTQVFAAEPSPSTNEGLTKPLLAIAAAIAIAGGLIGTGNAQQGIGAAGMGIIAEKPEKFGQVLFFFVIPETLWIIGFVLGIILLLGIL
jgi:V/A-type H+-transporting ATPase subunit K